MQPMTQPVQTTADKQAVLAKLNKAAVQAKKTAETTAKSFENEETPRCGVCSLFRHRRRRVAIASEAQVMAAEAKHQSGVRTSSLFGVGKKASANAKLQEAARAMEDRVAQLESRASSLKQQAVQLSKSGDKVAALRALKKAKAAEKQHLATANALDAVEQQVDLLEQASMQRALASALAGTSKSMKKNKQLLSQAESAVDQAGEVRDLASDLDGVMSEWAGSSNLEHDEDELAQELEAMCAASDGEVEIEMAPTEAIEAEKAELREKLAQAEWREAERLRQNLPSAPGTGGVKKKEERAQLLAQNAQ